MPIALLTSTLQVLKSLETRVSSVTPISDSAMVRTWSQSARLTLKMVLISVAVAGIELCYAAETAFVSPLLLQLGVPVYLMSMCWMLSPVLGFFTVPIMGSVSDTCTSRLGRRRPFILLYSVGVIIGLLLVPNGKDMGELLGDHVGVGISNVFHTLVAVNSSGNSSDVTIANSSDVTNANISDVTGGNSSDFMSGEEKAAGLNHPIGKRCCI